MAKKVDCSNPPCSTPGACCEEKKQQIEDCCPGNRGCPETSYSAADLKTEANVIGYHNARRRLGKRPTKGGLLSSHDCYYRRKCVLHSKTNSKKKCCPGQSGHHIVPDSAMTNSGFCYNYGDALTVCVAGSGNNVGNHGRIHNRLCKKLMGGGAKISFSDMLSKGVASAREVLTESKCDWQCLKKEIDKNHKDMSRDPKNKKGGCSALNDASQIDRNCGIASPGSIDQINDRLKRFRQYTS